MPHESKPTKAEWYKHGWGLVIAIIFFPYFTIWYAWAKSKWSQGLKIAVTAVVAVVMVPVLIGIATADTSKKNTNTSKEDNTQQSAETAKPTETPKPAETAKPTETPKPAETAKPTETVSQKNAVSKAKDYLNYSAFSYKGLIAQLEFEKFSAEDAKYGADKSGADWMEQAAKKAKDYMAYSSFSRGGLISQLEFDKFTSEQAAHGADSVGL